MRRSPATISKYSGTVTPAACSLGMRRTMIGCSTPNVLTLSVSSSSSVLSKYLRRWSCDSVCDGRSSSIGMLGIEDATDAVCVVMAYLCDDVVEKGGSEEQQDEEGGNAGAAGEQRDRVTHAAHVRECSTSRNCATVRSQVSRASTASAHS